MASRPREARRRGIVRHLVSAGLALFTVGVCTLGGCAGAAWPSNGQLPGLVVDKLTDCGEKGPKALHPVSYDLAFVVLVTEGSEEARVDDVTLDRSTLHIDEVEGCMRDALYAMRTPLEALALRRRSPPPDTTVAPEGRSLLGQTDVASLLVAGARMQRSTPS